jgi:flagellar motility protein MotE (MotC chaperone)
MAIVNKQQQAIHDAIDPKGAQIRELQKELKDRDARIERLNKNLSKTYEDTLKLHWLKEHGVMIETPDGMRYLKDEEFDEFLKSLPKFGDSMAGMIAQAMQNTKNQLSANILNKLFDETYEE